MEGLKEIKDRFNILSSEVKIDGIALAEVLKRNILRDRDQIGNSGILASVESP
jgi:hypothetical protein